MADPTGWALKCTVTNAAIAAQMPDAGSVFPAPLAMNPSMAGWTAAHGELINALTLDGDGVPVDFVIQNSAGTVVPWGLNRITQGASPELIITAGWPLLATGGTEYTLYQGAEGTQNRASVVPGASGFLFFSPLDSATPTNWVNGAVIAVTGATLASGIIGYATRFDGNDIMQSDNINVGNQGSVTFIAKPSVNTQNKRILAWQQPYHIAYIGGTYQIAWYDGDYYEQGTYNLGQWNQADYSWHSGTLSVAQNGGVSVDFNIKPNWGPTTGGLYIGANPGPTNGYVGDLCYITIASVPRSSNWRGAYYAITSAPASAWTLGNVVTATTGGGSIIGSSIIGSGIIGSKIVIPRGVF